MHRMWLVARFEFLNQVRRKSFLIGTLWLPVVMGLIIAISVFMVENREGQLPVGVVDPGGVLVPEIAEERFAEGEWIAFEAFADEERARVALEAGEIQGYFAIPEEYPRAAPIRGYYWAKATSDQARGDLRDWVKASLVADLPANTQGILLEQPDIEIVDVQGRSVASFDSPVTVLLPFVAGILFMVAVMSSATYLLNAITAEKESRTVEVMVSSMTPEQLIGGKAIGLIGVALVQLLVWLVTIVIGLVAGGQFVPALRAIEMPWQLVGIVCAYFLPSFVLVAGMMIALGAMVTDLKQAQQYAGLINMLFVMPAFAGALVFINPSHPIVVFLSYFPTTSFVMMAMRAGLADIPLWQLATSWGILVASAVGSVWLAARIFRMGMLRYGNALNLARALKALHRDVASSSGSVSEKAEVA